MSVTQSNTQFSDHLSSPLIRNATVRAYFGGISDMTLWRWRVNRDFPAPKKICGRNFWDASEVEQWRQDNAL